MLSMEEQPIDHLLGILESLAARPQMYVRPVEIATVQSYLWGLAAGHTTAGVPCNWPQFLDLMQEAAKSRGWEALSTGDEQQMREKGMGDASIIQELIAIYTDAIRLASVTPASE
jgi:hypothetical protein